MSDSAPAQLTISSKTYSAWSLRGWLLCRLAGLDIEEKQVLNDAANRAELLLLSPSVLVPRLSHDGASVWDTLAIAEYLNEKFPDAGLLPEDAIARAHCRSISGEIHSGFTNLRSALPMNLKVRHEFPDLLRRPARYRTDRDDLARLPRYLSGPFLFGKEPTIADAMYAPVTRRFITYAVPMSDQLRAYCETIEKWSPMAEWIAAAHAEPEDIEELDVEF